MKAKFIFILFIFLPLLAVLAKKKSDENTKFAKAIKISDLIKLDGKLNEAAWTKPAINEFTQKDPSEGQPATENTNVWVAYDESAVYIAAKLYDSKPELIDASLSRRDNWIDSDWFIFYVDSYNDKKNGYYFAVNAGGSIVDGVLYNDSWNDDSWDGIWESNVKIEDDGWSLEMKIPFNQLRFQESENITWGINFERQIKRNNESSYYVMVPKNENGFVSRFAELEGLNGIKPKQRFEILPYIVQKAQYLDHDPSDAFYKSNQYKTTVGADFKIGFGSNLTLDATLNPDFGQVEVDPAVVNLSAFETYFDEKRPFFIEGSNTFLFGIGGANNNWGFNFGWPTMFYSRRIGRSPQGEILDEYDDFSVDSPNETNILGAAKLTGKINETTTLGVISALTQKTNARIFTDRGETLNQEVEPFTHYGVLRTQKEFNGGNQSLGFMFTSVNRDLSNQNLRDVLAKDAYTFGLDGWTFLDDDQTYVLTGAFSGSYTGGSKEYLLNLQERPYRYFQRPDASFARIDSSRTSLSGMYGRLMLNKQKGNFYINSGLGFVTPGYEHNDLGFQFNADKINAHTVLGYRWFEPDGFFRSHWSYVAAFRSYNFDGDFVHGGFGTFNYFKFMNYYSLQINAFYNPETRSNRHTRGGPIALYPSNYYFEMIAGTDSREELILEFGAEYARDHIGGKYYSIRPNLIWKPSSQIYFSFGPQYSSNNERIQWVDNIEDDFAVNTFNNRYVFAEIDQQTLSANIRMNWTFTPTLSLQAFIQPLFAIGKYNRFKELSEPGSLNYNVYDENNISYNADDEEYTVDPDGNGPAGNITFGNPDFNIKSFRANVVLRWEVVPGSIFYFAWSHDQNHDEHPGDFNFSRDFKDLWSAPANDIFLVKFSYWVDM